jgi:hypothetical protein
LPFLAEARPEVLEAYQSIHGPRATATLRQRDFMVSFVRTETGRMAFLGVYRIAGVTVRPTREICASPAMRYVMDDLGGNRDLEAAGVAEWPQFDFIPMEALAPYKGRIEIAPRLTPTYVRRAEVLDAQIVALSPTSLLVAHPPDWRAFIVTGAELRALPPSWQARLREWRGIYLIVDALDGSRYVGSAYGEQNLLGRWQTHVANDVGVTVELARRRAVDFRFSILERVSPDMPAEDVIALERTWMERLDTIRYGLNR